MCQLLRESHNNSGRLSIFMSTVITQLSDKSLNFFGLHFYCSCTHAVCESRAKYRLVSQIELLCVCVIKLYHTEVENSLSLLLFKREKRFSTGRREVEVRFPFSCIWQYGSILGAMCLSTCLHGKYKERAYLPSLHVRM